VIGVVVGFVCMVVEAVSCEEQPQKMMNKPSRIKKRIPTKGDSFIYPTSLLLPSIF